MKYNLLLYSFSLSLCSLECIGGYNTKHEHLTERVGVERGIGPILGT